MGEDLIYTYRKMIPHMFIAIIGGAVAMAIVLIFSSSIETTLFWALFVAVWVCMFTAIVVEASRATRIIKGGIEGLPVQDITHALYWLSVICSGNASFSMGGINYWKNVDNVVNKMGGEYKATWQGILKQYRMPSTKKLYAMAALAILSVLGIFTTFILFEEFKFKIMAVGALFAVLIVLLYVTGDQFKAAKLLAEDPKVTEFTRSLVQTIVAWVSERTAAPIRVVLAGETFGAKPVDSLYGQIIAEIRPNAIAPQSIEIEQPPSSEMEKALEKQIKKSIIRRKIVQISAHLIVGSITGFLIYASFRSILSGNADAGHFIAAALSIGLFVFCQYIVYSLAPEFKVLFQGGKATPSDLQMLIERTPKSGLQSRYAGDADFKQKVDFMLMYSRQESVELSSLNKFIKLWLREDAKQPEKFRYFKTEANKVTLTGKGGMLAEAVRKKGSDIDKLLRQFEELQERARSLRHV